MKYRKLVSLFAVSALALGACATDDAEEPATDDTEEVEDADQTDDAAEETTDEEASSSEDLINQAMENSGDAYPEYGLTVGTWTEDGQLVTHAPGEPASVEVAVIAEAEEYNTYLLEDGVVAEVISDDPAPVFTVESPSADVEYVVGVSPDALGEVGDEVAVDDLYRSETLIFEEAAAEEAE